MVFVFWLLTLSLLWSFSYNLGYACGLFFSQKCSSAWASPVPPSLLLPEGGKRVLKEISLRGASAGGALLARVASRAACWGQKG